MYLGLPLALLAAMSPVLASAAPAVDKREADILNTFRERFAEASSSTLIPRADSTDIGSTCNLATAKMPTSKPPPPRSARSSQHTNCSNSIYEPTAAAFSRFATKPHCRRSGHSKLHLCKLDGNTPFNRRSGNPLQRHLPRGAIPSLVEHAAWHRPQIPHTRPGKYSLTSEHAPQWTPLLR
jgi:hypothetical protein